MVYALPSAQTVVTLDLPEGSRVIDALDAVAAQSPFCDLALPDVAVGVFGQRVERGQLLKPFDRVEIYRPLIQDPKSARRARAVSQTASVKK